MTAKRKKILFITPGAQSFGGNIFLLNFLRWYKENNGREFVTLYGHPGDLDHAFAALSTTYRYYTSEDSTSFPRKAAGKLANRMELRRAFLKSKIKRENIGMIYSNAVTNSRMLSMFDSLDVPVISHCHELESLIRLTGIDEFNYLRDRTSHFVAVSDAVRQNLVRNHDIDADKVSLIHAFTPIRNFREDEVELRRDGARRRFDIPLDAFVVGGSGTLNWRKSPELFVQLAHRVKKLRPDAPIYFLWIGGAGEGDFRFFQLDYDAKRLGVADRVRFSAQVSDALEYFTAIDVFAMVSREDPYPLVCLEAASLGKPVICFADAGGMPEFVEDDCGFVVPYLDIDRFAERVIELADDSTLHRRMSERAFRKVRERHDIEVSAPRLAELIERYV